eukprot:TRINITY_DN3842_c0_g3_i1.p2 TRINITY_DN3842_c0_g3~~TRINITY_DN3842_c0_g3_i1.p2  ORF type:complete len:304 (+),score=99.23 TRINITY_DN3842_c0_g3_i1:160-1071(+)
MKLQYGLNIPVSKPKSSKSKKPKIQKSNLFSVDNPDDDIPYEQKMQQQLDRIHEKRMKKAQKEHAQILAEDPYALSVDEVLDDIHRDRDSKQKKELDKKPKYVHKLIANARKKEIINELVEQRKLHRELEKEELEYGDQKKYITPEYENLLKETKRFAEEEKIKEEQEEKKRAESGSINDFYYNLSKNVAFGGEEEEEVDIEALLKKPEVKEPDSYELIEEKEREYDRKKRMRQRAERDREEAERLKEKRRKEREEKIAELKEKYSKRELTEDAVSEAKRRYLERQAQMKKDREEMSKKYGKA